MKRRGLFFKTFVYTLIALGLLVVVTLALFSQQFMSFYRTIQMQQVIASYQPLVERLQDRELGELSTIAQDFYLSNQSFEFYLADNDGTVLYATPHADTSDNFRGDFFFVVHRGSEFSIIAQSKTGLESFYGDLAVRAVGAFALLLVLCLICAYIFARQTTRPIRRLAGSTAQMARLEEVPPPPERHDELGELARDVHSLYVKLKETIATLEGEVAREREMEETQRYFFAAASHELKTPLAATGVLLEGMLANVGVYQDHPTYLRECTKLLDAQNALISEILEVVNLIDGKLVPRFERLALADLLASLLPPYQTLAQARGQRIILSLPEDVAVLSDEKMLTKAVSNVILNALQNAPDGAELRIQAEPADNQNIVDKPEFGARALEGAGASPVSTAPPATQGLWRLSLLNTDTRIDDDLLPRLFDPFYRVDKVRSRTSGRSGLGLTIVQKTLDALGVAFALENAPEGVLFWMELPAG